MSKWLMVLAACASLAVACKSDSRKSGLPPAQEWNTPVEPGTAPADTDMDNPHGGAMMDPDDPHAGLDMGDMGDMDMGGSDFAAATGMEAPDPNRHIDPNSVLKGVIKVSPALASLVQPDHVIFLAVKPYDPATNGPAQSPPMAVAKLDSATVPVEFELTEEDAMVKGTKLSGDVVITAHVSTTHDASTKQPGELVGMVRAKVPAENLELVLDTRIQ